MSLDISSLCLYTSLQFLRPFLTFYKDRHTFSLLSGPAPNKYNFWRQEIIILQLHQCTELTPIRPGLSMSHLHSSSCPPWIALIVFVNFPLAILISSSSAWAIFSIFYIFYIPPLCFFQLHLTISSLKNSLLSQAGFYEYSQPSKRAGCFFFLTYKVS